MTSPTPTPPSSRLSTTPLVEMSISPQPTSALRIQDSDHTFREEVLSVRLPIQKHTCTAGQVCNVYVHIYVHIHTFGAKMTMPKKILCCLDEGIFLALCSIHIFSFEWS